ncbi:MotA/TolQ/ExbB proton channel family protein [Aquibium microcysteis]|uniref:MotA/TolQ/ExbB proton channel family protein n=1 Tax=Aquibium microcysteis TaxID=675281 RepID=UPI00165D0B4A|nr:MotA/TolQ/ExbB proton channel family protein [Aquibium microcysteis]
MTSTAATPERSTREAARLLGFRAALFALVAAIAQALALVLLAPAFDGAPRLALALLVAAGPLLAAFLPVATILQPLAWAGIFFSALSTAGVAVSALPTADPAGWTASDLAVAFAGFAYWPLVASSLSAGRALDDLAHRSALMASLQRPGRSAATAVDGRLAGSAGALALYALAAAIVLLSALFLAATLMQRRASLEWLISTPAHVAIIVLFCAICVLLTQSWRDHLRAAMRAESAEPGAVEAARRRAAAQRRLLRTLIGLLPVLGFLGTVVGIIQALASLPVALADQPATQGAGLAESLRGIATAFETTLLGLVGSIAATLALAAVERAEAIGEADAAPRAPEPEP